VSRPRRHQRYTSYLAGVELDHAQDILADLTDAVVRALRPTFRVAKLPGAGLLTLVWLVGIWAIVFGVSSLALAYRLHGIDAALPAPAAEQ
jgi:hypothetical protein